MRNKLGKNQKYRELIMNRRREIPEYMKENV
jgi:hypothetical protein